MKRKLHVTDINKVQLFLDKNPELKEKLARDIKIDISKSKVETDINKDVTDNELAEELWMLLVEENTRLDTFVNLKKQILKFEKEDQVKYREVIKNLQKDLKHSLESIIVVREISSALRKAINYKNVSKHMKIMLENIETQMEKQKKYYEKFLPSTQ